MQLKKRFSIVERENILNASTKCLWTKEGEAGLIYLKEKRSLSDQTIKDFSLGYIPGNVKHQLSGRIIIPIFDASNNLIAISSRDIENRNENLPMYWHESYEKPFYLFGLNKAKHYARKWSFFIVTEGQFDVMQLYDKGMKNAVGLCSTNLHKMQIAMINRYAEEIVLILDKDLNRSGQKGTRKILSDRNIFEEYRDNNIVIDKNRYYNYKIATVDFGDIKENKMDVDLYIRKFGINRLSPLIKKSLQEMRKKHGM